MKKRLLSGVGVVMFLYCLAGCADLSTWLSSVPTAAPSAGALSLADLKYRLMDQFGGMGATQGIHYCDPDSYPVARVGYEQQQAITLFPSIAAAKTTFAAIVKRLNLTATTTFSDAQKLLIYQEYKKLNAITLTPAADGYTFALAYRDASGAFQVEGIIDAQGTITLQKKDPAGGMAFSCPICLVGATLIATPGGPVAVRDLRVGMTVWTVDKQGQRQPEAILKTAHIAVAFGHTVIHLRLSDGRELFASAPHPTADGRILGDLRAGDTLDGTTVVSAEGVAYPDTMTYDILPAGDTGFYWANGILLGSTLAAP